MLNRILNALSCLTKRNRLIVDQSKDGKIHVKYDIDYPDNFMDFFDYLVECKFMEQVISGLPKVDKLKFQEATLALMAQMDCEGASCGGDEDDFTEEELVEELNRPAMLPSQVFSNHSDEGEQKSTK